MDLRQCTARHFGLRCKHYGTRVWNIDCGEARRELAGAYQQSGIRLSYHLLHGSLEGEHSRESTILFSSSLLNDQILARDIGLLGMAIVLIF